jgi:hypothetical protein
MLLQDDEKEILVDDEIHQRIDALKQRRRNDKINQILSAAAEGDLISLKAALKVLNVHSLSLNSFVVTDQVLLSMSE